MRITRTTDLPAVTYRDQVSRDIPYADVSVNLLVDVALPSHTSHAQVVERINSALGGVYAGRWRLAVRSQRTDTAMKWMTFEASSHMPLDHLLGLSERAERIGSEGLTVDRLAAEFGVPQSERLAIIRELVVDAYRSARQQAEAMSESNGERWEVHSVSCDAGHPETDSDVALPESSLYRSPADGDADHFVLGPPLCSQRVSMAVSVTLVQMSALPRNLSEA